MKCQSERAGAVPHPAGVGEIAGMISALPHAKMYFSFQK